MYRITKVLNHYTVLAVKDKSAREYLIVGDVYKRQVPEPFIVMATQNPKGSAGTQLLPESQLDRFMICMSMGYPSHDAEAVSYTHLDVYKRQIWHMPFHISSSIG